MNAIDVTRDALALIAAADREDKTSVETMLATYHGEENEHERGMLLGALLAHAVAILHLASQTLGVPTDRIIGSVAASLNEPTPGQV
jgi:hypothetical protein